MFVAVLLPVTPTFIGVECQVSLTQTDREKQTRQTDRYRQTNRRPITKGRAVPHSVRTEV